MMSSTKPEDLFRAEKERATSARNSQHARLLAEAKAAFDKLMAEGQAARKSGRPRKHPLPPLKTSSSSRVPPRPPSPPPVAKPPVLKAEPVKPAAAASAKKAKPQAAKGTTKPKATTKAAKKSQPTAKAKKKR